MLFCECGRKIRDRTACQYIVRHLHHLLKFWFCTVPGRIFLSAGGRGLPSESAKAYAESGPAFGARERLLFLETGNVRLFCGFRQAGRYSCALKRLHALDLLELAQKPRSLRACAETCAVSAKRSRIEKRVGIFRHTVYTRSLKSANRRSIHGKPGPEKHSARLSLTFRTQMHLTYAGTKPPQRAPRCVRLFSSIGTNRIKQSKFSY